MEDSGRRVLLIDDDEDEFVLVQGVFAEMRGPFTLDWRATFEEGLAAIAEGRHECYLVDYQLGPRTGIELIRAAVARGTTRPLILLTGRSDEDVDLEALRAGAADYISKQELTPALLQRTLLYAIERTQAASTRLELEATRSTKEFQQQILAIVGHDLRGPLTAAHATLSALRRHREMPEPLKPRVDRVLSACARMERIIRDLTDYTQVRIGHRLTIAPQPANIHEICEELLNELTAAHPDRHVEYDTDGDPTGTWDPSRLAQALQNLLGNAIKYGRPDRPIRLSWRRGPPPEREGDLVLEVHNEGAPICPDLLPHIFEPFRRGEQAGGKTPNSLGLGLFIVKQIVVAHGGTVSVSSSEPGGTTFTLRLPREAPSPATSLPGGDPRRPGGTEP